LVKLRQNLYSADLQCIHTMLLFPRHPMASILLHAK
jgi:hypothetical protein